MIQARQVGMAEFVLEKPKFIHKNTAKEVAFNKFIVGKLG